MSGTVVEVNIPTSQFALRQTLSEIPHIEFEIERAVAHSSDRVMPFVWVSGNDTDREKFEEIISDDSSLDLYELIADPDDEWLYQMEWISEIETLVQILVEEEGTILAATGTDEGWNLRILFPDRDALSRTFDYCQDNGFTLDVRNIYQLEEGREGKFGLTEEQQDTLTAAFEAGYFSIPREVNGKELAADLDISHQAVSERLRRGYFNLIQNALIIGDDVDKEQDN